MLGQEEKDMVVGLMSFWNDRPTVVDVGSHKGAWCDLILSEFGDKCRVIMYEPNKTFLDYYKVKYDYTPNVVPFNLALCDKNGKSARFYYFDNKNSELSSLFDGKGEWVDLPKKECNVLTSTLDAQAAILEFDEIDCIKVDAEGAEFSIMNGAIKLLEENKCKFFLLEYGENYKRAGATFKEIMELVSKYDYQVYSFKDNSYIEVKPENFIEDYHYENYIITQQKIANVSMGWNGEFVKNTANLGKFDFVLEVGSFEGLNAKYIAENLLNEGGRCVCVDPLLDSYVNGDAEHKDWFVGQYGRFKRNTKGLPIELVRESSDAALPKMHQLRYDLIYLDGDHRRIYEDAILCMMILKIDGYLIIDDTTWRDYTTEATERFLNEFSASIQVIHKGYQVVLKKTMDITP